MGTLTIIKNLFLQATVKSIINCDQMKVVYRQMKYNI